MTKINYPAASSGVLEKHQLTVFMQLTVIIALAHDVAGNRIFVSMLPYAAGVISVSPEFSTPELFLHFGALPEYLPSSETLDGRDNLRHTVCWNRLDKEVHMIIICTDLKKFYLKAFLNLYADFLHRLIHSLVKNRASVLRRKYQVIYEYSNIMAFMYIIAHISILRRKRRGIQPEGIQADSGAVWGIRLGLGKPETGKP